MMDFFKLCSDMCHGFKDPTVFMVLNDEQIVTPIRRFIANYIGRQFLGITTEAIAYTICMLLQHLGLDIANEIEQKDIGAENKVPLDELYHKGYSLFLKYGTFTHNILAQASSLETNLKTTWEKMQEPKKLEQGHTLLKSSLLRVQNQITVFNWMYEDVLNQTSWLQNGNVKSKSKFLSDLQNESKFLHSTQVKLLDLQMQQKPLVSSIEQRLKWAAGANPDLNEILSAFENALSLQEKRLSSEKNTSNILINTCKAIIQHEMLRSVNVETKKFDQTFLNTCDKWHVACQFNGTNVEAITSVEKNIMKLYTPDMINNPKWLLAISEKISDVITTTQRDLEQLKLSRTSIIDEVVSHTEKIRTYYTQHCKLMTEFRPLIKSLTKFDEYATKAHKFIVEYRKYVDVFSALLHKVRAEMNADEVEESLIGMHHLSVNTESIFENLIALVKDEQENGVRLEKSNQTSTVQKQENLTRGEQKNAYAVGVWRRVRQKLEGRDPDPGRKCSVQEQVIKLFSSTSKR